MSVTIDQIKNLRNETGAPVMEIKKALEEAKGDSEAAKKLLAEVMILRAESKQGREAADGAVFSYIHSNGKVGVLLELRSETDFVARNEAFQKLGKEIAMQVASMAPKTLEELESQDYIRDPSKKIKDLVAEVSGTFGEKIKIARFVRYELGEE